MISSIFFLLSLFSNQARNISIEKITDRHVLKLTERYDQFIKQKAFDNPQRQHLLFGIERSKSSSCILAFSSVMSVFDNAFQVLIQNIVVGLYSLL